MRSKVRAAATESSPDQSARAALAADFSTALDETECAVGTLRFLVDSGLVRRGFWSTFDAEQNAVRALASRGFRENALQRLLDVAGVRETIGEAILENRGPIAIAPTDQRPLHAIPVGAQLAESHAALGALVLDAMAVSSDILQAAEALGQRLRELQVRRLLSDRDRLLRENHWLSTTLGAVSDPILFTDADGRILLANASAERLLTVGEGDSEGRRRAVALNNLLFSASLSQTGLYGARELPLVDPAEGEDLLFELISRRAETKPGEGGIVSVLRDVTDLRRASEEIEASIQRLRAVEAEGRNERDRLRLLLESVAEPVLVTDQTGELALVNPPGERLFTVNESAPPEASARVQANDAMLTSFLGNLASSPETRWRGRLRLTDPVRGTAVPVEAISAEVRSRNGGPPSIITILHDLTETMEKEALYEKVKNHSEELRKRVLEATQELAEQNELLRRQALELEQASAMKSQFLASMSHELRTPLNAIIGYAQILADGVAGPVSEAQQQKLRRLFGNARQLLALINDLLDISRIEAGKMPVYREPFRVQDLVDEVVQELEPLLQGSGLQFEMTVPEDLPAVHSDRQKVKQIVINLFSNALKFTGAGMVRITGSDLPAGDGVLLAVSDTGPGIAPENQRLIFEPFAQARRTGLSHQGRGTGLGLAISQRLATVLGGEIRLESELNRGSTFSLLLPRGVTQ